MLPYLLLLVFSHLAPRATAQCPAASVTTTLSYGTSTAVGTGTRATVLSAATGVFTTCAQGFVYGSGVATLQGGTVSLSGSTSSTNTLTPDFARATVTKGFIPTAYLGLVSVTNGGSVSIGDATSVTITVLPSATANVASGSSVEMDITSGIGIMTAAAGLMQVKGGQGDYSVIGSAGIGGATNGGTVRVTGTSYNAWASGGGIATMYGDGATCTALGGACTAAGNNMRINARSAGATAVATSGTNNYISLASGGYGFVSGTADPANSVYVNSGATASIGGNAGASISSAGVATVGSSVTNVRMSSAATATMYLFARATAAPGAVLTTASAGTCISSVSMTGTSTIWTATNVCPSTAAAAAKRRYMNTNAAEPQPTRISSRFTDCEMPKMECVNSNGVIGCVDVDSDLYNCGGCTYGQYGVTNTTGIDCTTLDFDDVQCVAGRCTQLGGIVRGVRRKNGHQF